MRYIKIQFLANRTNLEFYIEADDQYMEVRKIELADGAILGFANSEMSVRGTVLWPDPLLTPEEIGLDPSTKVFNINKEEFEYMWERVVTAFSAAN